MSQSKVIPINTHRHTHTVTKVTVVTKALAKTWKKPPFQRQLTVNAKVLAAVEEIKTTEVLPGVLCVGLLKGETYLVDGQHRIEAFEQTGLEEALADVRFRDFASMAEMADEFVKINSKLVALKPDDVLRGLEESLPPLRHLRQKCGSIIGYDQVRRSEKSAMVSMSAFLRCWFGSQPETPSGSGVSAVALAESLTPDESDAAVAAMGIVEKAWGRDRSSWRLYGNLNLTLCFWLYRRTVVAQYSPNTARFTKDLFTKCMMSAGANESYCDWLLGRHLSERDRSPAYSKLKAIVVRRYEEEMGKKPRLPQPVWAKGHA